jgi:hypothetical protein
MSGQQTQQSAPTPAPGSGASDKDAWIRRVLGTDPADEVAGALSRARAADAAAVAKGSVARAKLQLSVRQAHAEAVENLRALCAKVLALPEVKQEDRTAEVEAAVKRLADLIPPLDTALEEALGRYDAAKDAAERSAVARDAVSLLAGFQRKLSGNKVLRNIELFAKSDMAGMKVAQGLTGALADSAAEVGRAA